MIVLDTSTQINIRWWFHRSRSPGMDLRPYLALIDPLGSTCFGGAIWCHLGCQGLSKLFWQWWSSPSHHIMVPSIFTFSNFDLPLSFFHRGPFRQALRAQREQSAHFSLPVYGPGHRLTCGWPDPALCRPGMSAYTFLIFKTRPYLTICEKDPINRSNHQNLHSHTTQPSLRLKINIMVKLPKLKTKPKRTVSHPVTRSLCLSPTLSHRLLEPTLIHLAFFWDRFQWQLVH